MIGTLKGLFSPNYSNNQRPDILHVEGLAVLIAILIGAQILIKPLTITTRSFPAVLGFSSSITPTQVVAATNDQRVRLGVGKLVINNKLVSAAIAKGNDMCTQQYWAHISPAGVTPWVFMRNAGYSYSIAGENLARDFADTGSMVTAWMNSPTHRENIVNPKYLEIGVAVVDCKLLGSDTALVVQMFGSPFAPTAQGPDALPPATTSVAVAPIVQQTQNSGPSIQGAQSIPRLLANANPQLNLSGQTFPLGQRSFSALMVMKAVALSILTILILVLIVDMWHAQQRQTVRLVGRNLAHILFLGGIFIIIIIIKAGVVL